MTNCGNCGSEITGNFCANCGQPVKLKRIDAHYIVHEVEHILHFEKGILYTIRELVVRPGENVRDFLQKNRSRLVKPIIFLIVASLLYSLSSHYFHIDDGYVKYGGVKKSATVVIFKWIQDHYGYSNILMGVFIAAWVKLFFRKYDYNIYEILILLCFAMGMGMLVFAVFAVIQGITHTNLMQVAGYVGVAYCAWAIGQFFDKRKVMSYIKGIIAYILGMMTFFITALLIGRLIDMLVHH